MIKFRILQKCFQWEPSFSKRTDGMTDIQAHTQTYEANARLFRNFANTSKKCARELTNSSHRTNSPFILLAGHQYYNICLSLTRSMAIVLSRALSPIIHYSSFLCNPVIGVLSARLFLPMFLFVYSICCSAKPCEYGGQRANSFHQINYFLHIILWCFMSSVINASYQC